MEDEMNLRKFALFVSLILVVLMVAACGQAAPAEEPAAAEVPSGGQWCSGTDIVFFPGGSPGGPFATVVYNGAVAAAADLGANVEYVWSDWNPEKMVTQFAEAAATKTGNRPSP